MFGKNICSYYRSDAMLEVTFVDFTGARKFDFYVSFYEFDETNLALRRSPNVSSSSIKKAVASQSPLFSWI